jgi:competence protein ComEC
MSDRTAVCLALVAAAGALVARSLPLSVAIVVIGCAFAVRKPWLLLVGVGLLASALAARAWAGLVPPQPESISATATLLTDPEPMAGALRVELRVGHRHVEAWARGAAAGALYDRLAGERVEVTGRLRAVSPVVAGRLARRHIAAQLTVATLGRRWPGTVPMRLANRLRRTLGRGAQHLPTTQRSLFAGFVLGDDREQAPAVTDDFRGSGLSHLLVVSGENVAFMLVLAGPLLRRLELRGRFVVGMGVLLFFGLLTRWEPSVLRAETMAAIAMAAAALGRPVSSLRVLALAVTGLLLVDPMLVRSVGFLLSVGACTGIALLARPVADRLPGPRVVASAAGVTIAAQIGVAPVLVPVFGPLPLATLPANLLAMPAAGPVMVWGMTGGVAAGIFGPVAGLLHLPTRFLIGWVALVARVGARLPLGRLGGAALIAAAVLVLVARFTPARRVAVVLALLVVLAPMATMARPPADLRGRSIADGVQAWRSGGAVVLVVGDAKPVATLAGLRTARIARADLVIVTSAPRSGASLLAAIRSRVRVRAVLGLRPGEVEPGDVLGVGRWRVAIDAVAPRLHVAVCAQGGATVAACS